MVKVFDCEFPRIIVISRKGNYDIVHPENESVSTHIRIVDGNNVTIMSCNIRTECEIDDNQPEKLYMECEQYLRSVLYTSCSPEIKKVIEFMKRYELELLCGNTMYKLKTLEDKYKDVELAIKQCKEEIKSLISELDEK